MKYRKKSLVTAELIEFDNIKNLERLAAVIPYNERSLEAFQDHAEVGQVLIMFDKVLEKIVIAQCKTIEGLHTAQPPSMLMKGESGDMYFCTKEIFDETYETVLNH